jgi:DNA polymerase elongation subunit (family B)
MIVLVLDIETTGLSKEKDSITVIGTIVYESRDNTTISEKCFNVVVAQESADAQALITMKKDIATLLDKAECVVAFNGINFDMPFIMKWLQAEATNHGTPDTLGKRKNPEITADIAQERVAQTGANVSDSVDKDRWSHKYLDFCRLSKEYTGAYISLHTACLKNKIQVAKSGSGIQAIQWAKDKQWELLESYCMQDVVVLLALTKHAIDSGLTLPLSRYGRRTKDTDDSIVLRFDAAMKPFVHKTEPPCNIFDPVSPRVLAFDTNKPQN